MSPDRRSRNLSTAGLSAFPAGIRVGNHPILLEWRWFFQRLPASGWRDVKKAGEKCYALFGGAQERTLNLATAAKVLGLTREAARSMIRRRELPFQNRGNGVRRAYSDIEGQLIRYPLRKDVVLKEEP